MSDGFQIDPDAVRSVAGNIGGILMQTITLSRDLARLAVPPASFGQIGSTVAGVGEQLAGEQVQALHSLLDVLSDITDELARAAGANQRLDHQIAGGLDQLAGEPAHQPLLAGLWSGPTAGQLAAAAMAHAGAASDGHSVDSVLGYLDRAGLGQLGSQPIPPGSFSTPTSLVDWLDTDPDNQTRIGVIGVYSGDSGNLADVPGGLHTGDLVYVARWQLAGGDGTSFAATEHTSLGVVGSDGQLYNNGTISTADWHGVTNLRVYRPLS